MLPTWLSDILTSPFHAFSLSRRRCIEEPQQISKRRSALMPKPQSLTRKEKDLSYNPATNALSPLLNTLPLELRQQIYTYVLGSRVVHIFITPARLAHICCTLHTTPDFTRACCPSARQHVVPESVLIPQSEINVGLLLTCRQIYAETLSILYSSNTFDIDDLSAFNLLAANIPPTGLSAIRCLHLSWSADFPPLQLAETVSTAKAPYDDATYLRFWRTLASQMPALKELRMGITDTWWVRVLELEDPWVQPIKETRGLEVFDMEIVAPSHHFWKKEQVDEFTHRLRNVLCKEKA